MSNINQYPNESLTFNDDDFYDIDFFNATTSTYETKKILGSTIKTGILGAIVFENIYTQNGVLNSPRVVSGNNHALFFRAIEYFDFIGGSVVAPSVIPPGDAVFNFKGSEEGDYLFRIVNTTSSTEIFRVNHNGEIEINEVFTLPNVDGSANQVLATDGAGNLSWQNAGGTPVMAQGTTSQMLALTGQTVGTQFYNTTLTKVFTWSNQNCWYVQGETMIMNKGSISLREGNLCIAEAGQVKQATIALASATNEIIGISIFDFDVSDNYCVLAYAGIWDVFCSDDSSYSVSDFLVHDGSTGEDGQAKVRSSGNGHMAIVLEDKTVATGGGLVLCQIQSTERY